MATRRSVLVPFVALALIPASLCISGCTGKTAARKQRLRIGAKPFTESKILANMLWLLARQEEENDPERPTVILGNEMILDLLLHGKLDAYVDYSGTVETLLRIDPGASSGGGQRSQELERSLQQRNVAILSLGFQNRYEIAVQPGSSIKAISDLKEGRLRFTAGFLRRAEGWPQVKKVYGLEGMDVGEWAPNDFKGLSAVEAVNKGTILATDVYSTDPESMRLKLLQDPKSALRQYEAIVLYRKDQVSEEVAEAFAKMAGEIQQEAMTTLIQKVESQGQMESVVAEQFLRARNLLESSEPSQPAWIPILVVTFIAGLGLSYMLRRQRSRRVSEDQD